MVYERFSKCFILEDPSLRSLELFQATVIVDYGDIFRSTALMLRVNKLLVMTKYTNGLCLIAIGEVFL